MTCSRRYQRDGTLDSLHLLAPQQRKPSVFKSSVASEQLRLADAARDASDLCLLDTILFVSAPGLHYSDLNYLPSSADANPLSIKSSLRHAANQQQQSVLHPYVPFSRRGQLSSPERVIKRYVDECGAVLEAADVKNFWSGGANKVVRLEVVEGLDEWELTGNEARQARRKIMEKLVPAEDPRDLVSKLFSARPTMPLRKRQFDDEAEDVIGVTEPQEQDSWTDDVLEYVENAYDGMADTLSSAFAPKKNQTSIFEPAPGTGLLHRYVFFSTPLIIALGLTLLVFIPILLMTTRALGTTSTLKGLETKMTGQVAIDSSKSG
ncbi:hypothetical protein OIV83_000333 [Microbotryomycetes sp. JL201]|nr:hypothetical protein OIV83_000333 [Microbotryomycetes sp. JL201]